MSLLKIKPRLTSENPDAGESSAMALTSKNNRCHAQRGCLVEVYGRKIADDTPDKVRTNQKVIDAYLGAA